MRFLVWTICFSCCLFFTVSIKGQQVSEPQPLETVLVSIQEKFDCRFNYTPETIEGLLSTYPETGITLESAIEHLSVQTGLEFNLLPNKFISIRPPDPKFCGILKDESSGEPIAFATIWSSDQQTLSDEEGFFVIPVNVGQGVTIRHLSYQTTTLLANDKSKDCREISIPLKAQILPEIVLSDFMIAGIDKLNNGAYNIDFDEFTILPGLIESDVLQSVQAFPGILSVNETVSNINIRGGSHDQNLILWDGIKMYQSGHFFGLISLYNPQITQSVSLRKNGSPAILTDGVSGTIDMKTAQEVNQQIEGNIGVNFTDANAFIDIPLSDRSSIHLATRKSISNLVKTPTYSQYFNRVLQDTEVELGGSGVVNSDINFDFLDGSLRWVYQPTEGDEIRVNFLYATNELEFTENALVDGREVSRKSSLNQTSIAGAVYYHKSWSQRFNTQLKVYESDYKLKSINANIPDDQRFLQENKVSETGVSVNGNYKVWDQLQVNGGYQFIETKITNLDDVDNPIFRLLEAEVVRAHALFSELGIVSNSGQTKINLGGRLNYLEKFEKFIVEPRVSLNHNFSKWWNFEILGEFKHQYSSQIINFQNDFLGIEKRRWQLANNDSIPIIISKQISTGLSYSKSGWLLNGVAYYKSVDGITAQSQGFQNQFEFLKASGSYTSMGLDLLIRKQLSYIDTWLSYSYLESNYSFPEFAVTNFPSNFDIRHAVSLGATYNKHPFLFSGGLNWRSGKPTTRPEAVLENEIVYKEPNSEQLKDYLRLDVSATYQYNTSPNSYLELGLSIWNLLDKKNEINNFYRLDETGQPNEVIQESLGFTPNLMVRFYF